MDALKFSLVSGSTGRAVHPSQPKKQVMVRPDVSVTIQALKPLRLACSCGIPRVVEPALGCVHKLVSLAWIKGESSPTGSMDDGNVVGEIVSMVVKCVEMGHSGVYLAVVRALLTFTTVEHFVAHGQCLLFMVKSIFNLAISCDETDLRRTAWNALLQMLNTIVKRVTVLQFQMTLQSSASETVQATLQSQPGVNEAQEMSAHAQQSDNDEDLRQPSNESPDPPAPGLTAQLASLAEQQDIEGLEAALEQSGRQRIADTSAPNLSTESESDNSSAAPPKHDSEAEKQVSGSRETEGRRPKGWDNLTVAEKDVVIVVAALCKLAGTSPADGASEDYFGKGKLLALELLVKLFEHSGHKWGNVRNEFCEQLRLPLCLVLVRNCTSEEAMAFQFSVRLFCAIILQEQLRFGLKAELGALYPLLLLKPLDNRPLDSSLLFVALSSIKRLIREPQMQVDIFINYDCDLHAANLYERTANTLSDLAILGDPGAPSGQGSRVRDAAIVCCMSMLSSLDAWAGPIWDTGANDDSSRLSQAPSSPSAKKSPEVVQFSASKEKKNSINVGFEVFNRNPLKGIASLVSSGAVENRPESLGLFLRTNREKLDESMLGEYLGHHDEVPISVMHAYIDLEQYEGISIDLALRKLLAGFRLPGEAQKIDRIMEKFAGKYCQDNPTVFECPDDAYLLAFAIIMLNTDAHNPMAEQMMSKTDFVSMNCRATEPGVNVLPVQDLEAIFDRITGSEIQTRTSNAGREKIVAASVHTRLASALGLSQLTPPFRSGIGWNRTRWGHSEHRKLIEVTRKAMRKGISGGDIWYTACHTDHARPMLEAAGPSILKALAAALECATAESASRAVESFKMAIELAAVLGCDALCHQMVGALANGIGLHSQEALIRANPHCQVLALQTLVYLANSENAGLLGSSWTTILRTISSVESLVSELRRNRSKQSTMTGRNSKSVQYDDNVQRSSTNPFGRLLSQIGLSTRLSMDGLYDSNGKNSATTRAVAGGPLRTWVDKNGSTEMDKVFVGSSSLDGDAVLVFTRALCAVSLEELNPDDGINPRVYSLRKLVECAYYNLERIRLVWNRLWSAISAHLVNASCHPDQTVAMDAVDSLGQLVGKLLVRAELATFTRQVETLRPFVTVLKHCSSVAVRELTVQCVEKAMTSNSGRLGSGWTMVMEALMVGVSDPALSVVQQSLNTLQLVVDQQLRKWGEGHNVITECIKVAHACANNPCNADTSLQALRILQCCADELISDGSTEDFVVVPRSASMHIDEDVDVDPLKPLSRPTATSDTLLAISTEVISKPVDSSDRLCEAWAALFKSLSSIITREERRRCADAAADILYNLVDSKYSRKWDIETWRFYVEHSARDVFDALQDIGMVPGGTDRILTYARKYLPVLWEEQRLQYKKVGHVLLPIFLDLLVGWMGHSLHAIAVTGMELLQVLIKSVSVELDPPGWDFVICTLKEAWSACTALDSAADDSIPIVSWAQGTQGMPDLSAIRSRCQVLISFQQLVDEIHTAFSDHIPAASQLDLVDILILSVNQAASANRNDKFLQVVGEQLTLPTNQGQSRVPADPPVETEGLQSQSRIAIKDRTIVEELKTSLSDGGRTSPFRSDDSPEDPDGKSPEPQDVADISIGKTCGDDPEIQEAQEENIRSDTKLGQAPLDDNVEEIDSVASVKNRAHEPSEAKDNGASNPAPTQWPELRMDVRDRDQTFNGLMRVEAEGGVLVIKALQRCVESSTMKEIMGASQNRLLDFCKQLIKQAADDAVASWGSLPSHDSLVLTLPARAHWCQAVRAPVVSRALDAYRNVAKDAFVQEMKVLFPYLSKLMFCQQIMVRKALSNLLHDQLSTLLSESIRS